MLFALPKSLEYPSNQIHFGKEKPIQDDDQSIPYDWLEEDNHWGKFQPKEMEELDRGTFEGISLILTKLLLTCAVMKFILLQPLS